MGVSKLNPCNWSTTSRKIAKAGVVLGSINLVVAFGEASFDNDPDRSFAGQVGYEFGDNVVSVVSGAGDVVAGSFRAVIDFGDGLIDAGVDAFRSAPEAQP